MVAAALPPLLHEVQSARHQSTNKSINRSATSSINQAVDQSKNRSTDRSINQSINQSINHSIFMSSHALCGSGACDLHKVIGGCDDGKFSAGSSATRPHKASTRLLQLPSSGPHLICTGMPSSHTRRVLSSLLLTNRRPSSTKVTVLTAPKW